MTAAAALVSAGLFLRHQTLWIDETTQLSGLRMSPLDVVRWLANPARHDFGVPADRMPPLAYWMGWLWSRLFGLNEFSLRLFGVTCTVAATVVVVSTARRAFGGRAGLFAGLFLALSPNVCVTAVEIRAYPLFLLVTACALRALVSVLVPEDRATASGRGWVWLGGWLVASMYTHFFGLVFAGAVVVSLGLHRRIQWVSLRPVIGLGAVMMASAAGLVPFVVASAGISSASSRDRVREAAQLIYRLIAHPAMTVIPMVAALAGAAAVLLLVSARKLSPDQRPTFGVMAAILVTGLSASIVANFLLAGFAAARPSYSTWALPVLALALSAPLALPAGRWARLAQGAALALLVCEGSAVAQLAVHGDYFAHGPHRHIQEIVDRFRGRSVAVVYADPTEGYAAVYFPLFFQDGPGLPQFVLADGGDPAPVGIPVTTADGASRLGRYDVLVAVRARRQGATELARQIRQGDEPFDTSRFVSTLERSGRWVEEEHRLFVSFVAADVTVLERRSAPALP